VLAGLICNSLYVAIIERRDPSVPHRSVYEYKYAQVR
jgi:hypothetical protein